MISGFCGYGDSVGIPTGFSVGMGWVWALKFNPHGSPANRSLTVMKLVPFESMGVVSYSPSIVTVAVSVAVCEIFSVKEWRDLENQIRGRSRSLKMAPFDRPYATFYWSVIVNIALSCTIFELFDVE